MKKTYFVSIACLVPVNHQIEVDAKNKDEALAKALNAFDEDGLCGESEEDYQGVRLDVGENPTPDSNGVWIEEK